MPLQPRPPVFAPISATGGIVEIILPIPYSTHAEHPVDYFIAQYRQMIAPGRYGAYVIVNGSVGALRIPLPQLEPNTDYEVVLLARNQEETSQPSLPSLISTPRAGMQPIMELLFVIFI